MQGMDMPALEPVNERKGAISPHPFASFCHSWLDIRSNGVALGDFANLYCAVCAHRARILPFLRMKCSSIDTDPVKSTDSTAQHKELAPWLPCPQWHKEARTPHVRCKDVGLVHHVKHNAAAGIV